MIWPYNAAVAALALVLTLAIPLICSHRLRKRGGEVAGTWSLEDSRKRANELGEIYRTNQQRLNLGALTGLFGIATWLSTHGKPPNEQFVYSALPFLAGLVITQVSVALAKLRFIQRMNDAAMSASTAPAAPTTAPQRKLFHIFATSIFWDSLSLALFAAGITWAVLTFPSIVS